MLFVGNKDVKQNVFKAAAKEKANSQTTKTKMQIFLT